MATTGTVVDDPGLWLLKRRHEELALMFRAAWDNYIKFYTIFLTFTLGAMGWLVVHKTDAEQLPHMAKWIISGVFILQTILVAITSGSIALYSKRVGIEYDQTEQGLLGPVPAPPTLARTIPVEIAVWAGWANVVAMLAMIPAWLYFGCH